MSAGRREQRHGAAAGVAGNGDPRRVHSLVRDGPVDEARHVPHPVADRGAPEQQVVHQLQPAGGYGVLVLIRRGAGLAEGARGGRDHQVALLHCLHRDVALALADLRLLLGTVEQADVDVRMAVAVGG